MDSVSLETVDRITADYAQRVLENYSSESSGAIKVNDTLIEWWTDGRWAVWFYEEGHVEEDTIKRYEIDLTLYEVPKEQWN